jgi:hypothetical protein
MFRFQKTVLIGFVFTVFFVSSNRAFAQQNEKVAPAQIIGSECEKSVYLFLDNLGLYAENYSADKRMNIEAIVYYGKDKKQSEKALKKIRGFFSKRGYPNVVSYSNISKDSKGDENSNKELSKIEFYVAGKLFVVYIIRKGENINPKDCPKPMEVH